MVNSPFSIDRSERVLQARTRYLEEGVLPTGLVSEAVFQSWSRCYRDHKSPSDKVAFQPVTHSRSQLALQKNRVLHEAWMNELPALGMALGSAACSAILTDASGVLIGASPSGLHNHHIIPAAHRLGVSLAEELVGTTAPGIVARTGKQASVLGAEHYFDSVKSMYCSAAPIRNLQGHLAGILDISSEGAPFHFDPAAVVGLYAASIENRFLVSQSRDHLVVRFQFLPAILDTPMAGLMGFDMQGQLVWVNSVASHMLGLPVTQEERGVRMVEDIFDTRFSRLASLSGKGLVCQRLLSGVNLFLRCEHQEASLSVGVNWQEASTVQPTAIQGTEQRAQVTSSKPSPAIAGAATSISAEMPAHTLKQAQADLIVKYLTESNGNVSLVAKRLKVSRGLVYRRLQILRKEFSEASGTTAPRSF